MFNLNAMYFLIIFKNSPHLMIKLMVLILCRTPKFLVDPLEGPSMRQCESGWNLGHDPDFQH